MVSRIIEWDLAFEKLTRNINDINARLNEYRLIQEELRKKPDVPSEFKELKESFFEKSNIFSMNISEFDKKIKELNIKFGLFDSFKEKVSFIFEDILKKDAELDEKISKISTKSNENFKNIEGEIQKIFAFVRSESERIHEKIKSEILVSPASVLDTNQKILRQLDILKMDMENALLKLANFESQQVIFNRKLENLDIRIKKLELEKQ